MIRRIFGKTSRVLKSAALGAALLLCAIPSFADDVILRSKDGGIEIAGRVLDFDGRYLQVTSTFGPVTVLYDNVTCEGVDCPSDGQFVPRVRLNAPTGLAEVLVPALIQRYATTQGHRARTIELDDGDLMIEVEGSDAVAARFEIRLSKAEEGFADFVAIETDMVLSRREITAEEFQRATGARVMAPNHRAPNRVVGYDALIPIVAPRRNARPLTIDQMIRSYRGQISSWTELDRGEGQINLHLVDEFAVWGAVREGSVTRHEDFNTAVAAVVADPMALGFVSLQSSGFAQQVEVGDTCGFVFNPGQSSVKTQDYPLTVPVYLYVAERRLTPFASDFISWLSSPEAQLVVRRSGLIDAALLPIPLDQQGQRFISAIRAADDIEKLQELQDLSNQIEGRTRLSMSFRFLPGGVRLDGASLAYVARLTEAINRGEFAGRSVLLMGFSDGQGDHDRNRELSLRRAEAVKEALLANIESDVEIETAGFGEILPVGCDDTRWGRHQNRRVELWVGD